MSKNLLWQPRCHKDTLHFFSYKMKRKIRLNKLHNLYDLVYNSAVCENNLITPTELHRGRWPTNAHKLHTFFAFCTRKKVCIKEWVLSMFLLLLFNAFSLLCSPLFWKIKVSCFKMKLPSIKSIFPYLNKWVLYQCSGCTSSHIFYCV